VEKPMARPGSQVIRWGTIGVVAGLLSVAPSATAQASPKVMISFEVAEYSTKTVPFWQSVVKGFEAANPNYQVQLSSIGWNQAHDTTVRQIAAHDLPDLVNTATIWLPEWVGSGALQPVTAGIVSPSVKSNFLPALYNVSSLYNGKVWGLPIAAATRALFYNKTLFSKAGLNPNDPPKTWAQLYSDATAIKDKAGAYGFAFEASDVQAFRYFGYFLWNAGGNFFNNQGKAAFNSPAGVSALNFLVKAWDAKLTPNPIANDVATIEPLFEAGKVGLWIDSSYLTADIAPGSFTYGTAPVPVESATTMPVNWGVTDVLVVSKSANTAQLQPFLDYIYGPKVQAKFDTNEGFVPLEKSEAAMPQFKNPVTQQFVSMLEDARFDPMNSDYNQMQTILKNAFQSALLGKQSSSAALNSAAQQFNSLAG
jgi:multiple sugar transport system substrate-binding protein